MIDLLSLIGSMADENEFKKRFRLHQGWWRAFVLGENEGKHPIQKNASICNTLLDGKAGGKNFISQNVKNVIKEVLVRRNNESAGKIDEDRLYNNLLSSQPLCFNFFAPFYTNLELGLNFLKIFYPEITSVNAVYFEHSNSEYKYDNSAFDVAFEVSAKDKKGIIGFECKYTDSFSQTPYKKSEYESILSKSDIWAKSYEELTAAKYNQLFRNQLIGESLKQNKNNKYDFAYLALFCHHEDLSAIKIALEYQMMLKTEHRHNFQIITYKDFFTEIMKLDLSWEMREYFLLLWARYCGLELSDSAFKQLKAL